jgi:DNA polymerase/3'-5' exonuclease PolX
MDDNQDGEGSERFKRFKSSIDGRLERIKVAKAKRSWTIEEAIKFSSELEEHLGGVYHVALAGSVLTKGTSSKDIDVIIFPHTNGEGRLDDIRERLTSFEMILKVDHEKVKEKWREGGSKDTKMVEIWKYGKKRVDIFMPWLDLRTIDWKVD